MLTPLPLLMLLTLSAPVLAPTHPAPAELGGDWPAQPSGKKVTIDAKTANEALRGIAAAAGWGLALSSPSSGEAQVEFSFKDVPVEDALAAVLYASHLHSVRIGDTVAVNPGPAIASSRGDDLEEEPSGKNMRKFRHRWHHSNGNDRVQFGHDIDIPAGEKVGNVVAVGGSVHLGKGASADDVVAIGGHIDADPDAQVGGNVVAIGGDAHLGTNSSVSGNAVTLGGAVQLDQGANIAGQQVNMGLRHMFEDEHPAFWAGGMLILFWVRKLAEFVLYFCLGALLVLAAPTQLAAIESFLARQTLRAGLAGFLATLAIPILAVLLIVTLVGIPLVAVEIFGVALAGLMGFTAISVLIGNRLRVPVRGGGLLGLAIGTAIVVALTSLPWVGGIVLVTGWFVALGAALVTRFGSVAQA